MTVISVLVAGCLIGGTLFGLSAIRGSTSKMSPQRAEHWLVERAAARPRLGLVVAGADRRLLGGASVAVSLLVVTIAGAIVGLLFDSLESQRGFANGDTWVAQWGADHATATSTSVLIAVTHAGSTWILLPVMAAVGVLHVIRGGHGVIVGFLATTGIGIVVVNNGLKLLVDRDRPPVVHLVQSSGASFPSGHSAAAAACWAALALVAGRGLAPRHRPLLAGLAVSSAVAVAASRALLGVHWLTDVIAGVIVGWAWFLLVAIAFGGRIVRLGQPAVDLRSRVYLREQKEKVS